MDGLIRLDIEKTCFLIQMYVGFQFIGTLFSRNLKNLLDFFQDPTMENGILHSF